MSKSDGAVRSKSKMLRAARLVAIGALLLFIGAYAALEALKWYAFARPPKLAETPLLLSANVSEESGVRRIGDCWIARKNGLLRMDLQGDPFTLGYCNAVLTQEYIELQERDLIEHIDKYIPSKVMLSLLKIYVLIRNRDLPSYISKEYQMELYGISRGYKDPFPEIAPLYHRVLNYHAAHDISHVVMDSPFMGCTSFAAWGSFTENGHLLMGRNFDFSAGRAFDTNKIVIRSKPEQGLRYISVAWPGMIGVVSGINEAKIAATINASQSEDKRRIGTPVSFVMRRVMQYASTLDEAVAIIKESQVFVSDNYFLADGKSGEVIVVEKTPLRTAVRRPDAEYMICANHFLSDSLKTDAKNLKHMQEGTSVIRYERMEELVRSNCGKLSPTLIAKLLRDQEAPGGASIGMGNASAINMLGATHSVIIDVTEGVIWISVGPHQLGAYYPFSVKQFEEVTDTPVIPAAAELTDGSYERYLESEQLLSRAQKLLKGKRFADASKLLLQAEHLNPGYYLPPMLLGKIANQEQKWAEAEELLKKAAKQHPPYASERDDIQEMLETIRTKREGASS